MGRNSQKNRSMIIIACILGILYATYLMYEKSGGIGVNEIISLSLLILIVLAILWVVKRFLSDRRSNRRS